MTACNVCRQDKPRESFSADRRRKDGLQARCKSCAAEIAKKWRLENPERVTAVRRDWEKRNPERHLLTKFGIRADEKRAIFEAQGSVCGACGSGHHGHPRIEGETGWCLDHCHASGKIRGVLCWRCNLALGYAGDSPDALRALAAYIESHHGVNAAKNTTSTVLHRCWPVPAGQNAQPTEEQRLAADLYNMQHKERLRNERALALQIQYGDAQ